MNQKCFDCNSNWNTEKIMEKCPFCGKSLIKKDRLTLSSAIRTVVKINGIDIFNTPNRFISYIMDYVKGEEKNKKLLRIACTTTALQYVVQAVKSDTQKDIDFLLTKARITIENEVFFSEENARYIIQIIADGLGLSYTNDIKNSNSHYEIGDIGKLKVFFDKGQGDTPSERIPRSKITQKSNTNQREEYLLSLVKNKKRVSKGENIEIFSLGRYKLHSNELMLAIELIRFSAQHGCKAAAFLLGYCYDKGIGVNEDKDVAKAYYRQGAISNLDFERYTLTNSGLNSDGFKKAAEYGKQLYYELNNTILIQNIKTTPVVQQKNASNERSKRIYLHYKERPQNYLSNMGHLLGIILTNGRCTQEDNEQILEWGRKYIRESNYTEAFKYIQFAAKHGLKEANLLLGYMYDNGYGVRQDKKAARGYYWQGVASVDRYKEYYDNNGFFLESGYKKAAEDGKILFIRS